MIDGVAWFTQLWANHKLIHINLDRPAALLEWVSLEVDSIHNCSAKCGNYGAHWNWGDGKTAKAFWRDFASFCKR